MNPAASPCAPQPLVTPVGLEAVKTTIWLTRPDLRALCQGDRSRFDAWLLLNGAREYQALAQGFPVSETWHEPAAEAFPGLRPAFTGLMKLIWSLRSDLQAAFDITTSAGQRNLVWWFFIYGVGELDLVRHVTAEQRHALAEPDERLPQDAAAPISRLVYEVWLRRPDVQKAFALEDSRSRHALVAWFAAEGAGEMGLGGLIGAPPSAPSAPAVRVGDDKVPFGVNLIGHARGQFGIGEDVRMAALALQAVGIPFTIRDVEPGREVCQGDDSVAGLISDSLPYAVTLFCTTGIETARLMALEGPSLFEGRRSIGCWPWELPEWPAAWLHAYDLVDEVWASSHYTAAAYAANSPKPVRHVPMAVTAAATAGLTRRDFGLPDRRFLFVFAFDVLSGMARKNPQACIQAFRAAFPQGNEPVGLVLKAMRGHADNPAWCNLMDEAGADSRITIIGRTLGRGETLDLYRACDGFVSLHRAEGFGRGLAEAMLIGRPVIATGYSGNMDFTTPGTAALVDYELHPLLPGEYPFAEGQVWAEPDVGHAAWWMRRLVGDDRLRTRIARQGQAMVASAYGPTVVGTGYAALLQGQARSEGSLESWKTN